MWFSSSVTMIPLFGMFLPLFSPRPHHPRAERGVCLSVCQRGLSGHRRRSWDGSPLSPASRGQLLLQKGGGSHASQVNGCCWRAPLPHVRAWAHSCLFHHPQLRARLQETSEDHKPGVCRVWVFPFSKYLQPAPTVDVEAPRTSGAILPHSSLELRGEPLAVFQTMRKDSGPLSHS